VTSGEGAQGSSREYPRIVRLRLDRLFGNISPSVAGVFFDSTLLTLVVLLLEGVSVILKERAFILGVVDVVFTLDGDGELLMALADNWRTIFTGASPTFLPLLDISALVLDLLLTATVRIPEAAAAAAAVTGTEEEEEEETEEEEEAVAALVGDDSRDDFDVNGVNLGI